MNKKVYIEPTIKVVSMSLQRMITASGKGVHTDVAMSPVSAMSRRSWDDWDVEDKKDDSDDEEDW